MKLLYVSRKYYHLINPKLKMKVLLKNYNKYNIYIVYFVNCLLNKNYLHWIYNQINMVKYMKGKIYIIAVIKKKNKKKFIKLVSTLYSNIVIKCYYKNEYEYRGILQVWELGQKYNKSNDIILYFHSKGITHYKNYNFRNKFYNIILKNINWVKEIFDIFPTIDKIGYSSGGNGWIWYNFWYSRGSYIVKLEKPIKNCGKNRWYYETWLGKKINKDTKENSLNNCYNYYTLKNKIGNIGFHYNNKNRKYHSNL